MLIPGSKEGARAWKKRGAEKENCIRSEYLSPSNENASYEAMERISNLNKIFYYDIETNTNKCSASDATITSICGSLCTGGDATEDRCCIGRRCDNISYMDHQRNKEEGSTGIDINAILGGCCTAGYEGEYNLNAVLAKVSQVGDKMAILKDPIDNAKQLLGYLSLKTAKEQAPVHK
ncbi:hypothetical protein O3P69_006248 [Scylla paramamosain]|uniref:Uncharacterized protein n=1 Tax=Scylla paramamosain TaxID=85552 RepID=A0AAW0U7H0_SCYPA